MRSRDKVIEATLAVIADRGFAGVSIAAVAEGAHVSRQTIYTIFGTREDLVSQSISDLFGRLTGQLQERLASASTTIDYLAELIVAGRSMVRSSPVLAALLRAGDGPPLFDAGVFDRARPIVHELLSPIVTIDPGIALRFNDFADYFLHFGTSLVIFDDGRSDDDLRAFVVRWMAPVVDHAASRET